MNADANKTLLERLSSSETYRNYEQAFGEATGLPLSLSPVEDWHLAHHHRRHENPFCAMLAQQSKTCAACLRTQQELGAIAREQSKTVTCFAGLCETAIPLRVGENLIGFLRTGEAMLQPPSKQHLNRVARQLLELGLDVDGTELRRVYFHTRVISQRQYDSALQLLRIFAQHLSILANQIVFRAQNSEPPIISRAREYISANLSEDLSLASVAKAVHMSTFYFCKQFKKATGLNFTSYLGRVRVERAKERLLDPNARVSEIAFEVGFQSLTHFNRVFRKLTGESPSAYRGHLPLPRAA